MEQRPVSILSETGVDSKSSVRNHNSPVAKAWVAGIQHRCYRPARFAAP